MDEMMAIFGNLDEYIKLIEKDTNTTIAAKDGEAIISGEEESVKRAHDVINSAAQLFRSGEYIDENRISYLLDAVRDKDEGEAVKSMGDIVAITHKGKPVKCKTIGQKNYMRAIEENTVVFAIGPAGTGKTYLAMAKAIVALKNKEISRIILTRPAVEAGEKLGFLPGDLQDKVDPYLRPLYDALYDVLGRDASLRLKEKEAIEVVPLAYMRGRTLDNSFIILDEAQNTTREQMKMFLTRMGFGSKVVVTGDVTQIDLPRGKKSGLVEASKVLKDVADIDFCYLKDTDVVRHELVKKIINAYDRYYKKYPEDDDEHIS